MSDTSTTNEVASNGMTTLTQSALDLLKAYEGIPYFNNSRERLRMGLRAQVGKGTPEEIAEEAQLAAFREHIDLSALTPETHKKFLVDHKLGIDCSGFAYHLLDAESRARGLGSLSKHLTFPYANDFARRIGRFLRRRYVENADVKTFAHALNSRNISLEELAPGDFFVRLESPRDHMILVTEVRKEDGPPEITLAQSESRPSEGRYGHGVRVETIPLSNLQALNLSNAHRFNWF